MKGNTHMKFDIARAWKDETYRQTLSDEQLEMLPANPAGELNDAEMVAACGGGGEEGDFGFGGVASSSSSETRFSREHFHSLSLLCDISVFSINLIQANIIPIASQFHQTCAESH
jgi:mersacidin/lichenicidin family type 2 lantibiotic